MKKRLILLFMIVALIAVGGVVSFITQQSNKDIDIEQYEETNDSMQRPTHEENTAANLTLDQLTEEQIVLFKNTALLFNDEVISGEMTLDEMDTRQDEAMMEYVETEELSGSAADLFREWKQTSGFYHELEEKMLAAEEEKNSTLTETEQSDFGAIGTKEGAEVVLVDQAYITFKADQSTVIDLNVTPADAKLSVSTDNPDIKCELNGHVLTITALSDTANGTVSVIAAGGEEGTAFAKLEFIVNVIPLLTQQDISAYKREVWELVNAERARAGMAPLEYVDSLQYAADIRAEETCVRFSHTRPNGSSCFTIFNGVQHTTAGENIASGQKSPERVMEGWMNSPGHRANILENEFTGMAVGIAQKNGVVYWAQLFIG